MSYFLRASVLLTALLPLCCEAEARDPSGVAKPASSTAVSTVYHVQEGGGQVQRMFMLVLNHLGTDPHARIIVVAHLSGIEFLRKDAVDHQGAEYEPAIRELHKSGRVRFLVCGITLASQGLSGEQLVPEAEVVKSGVVEIARLQVVEHAAYLRP